MANKFLLVVDVDNITPEAIEAIISGTRMVLNGSCGNKLDDKDFEVQWGAAETIMYPMPEIPHADDDDLDSERSDDDLIDRGGVFL